MGVNGRSLFNNRHGFMIPFKFNIFIFFRNNYIIISYNSVVARYFSRRGHSGASYFDCGARVTMRNSIVYCIGGVFFLLDFFGISVFNPFQVPLLNTIILISSGIRVTWAHHSLIAGNFTQTYHGLVITVLLGIYFTMLQGLEYFEARFTFADRVYGSTFFIATGFHGLHVLVGTLFLIVTLFRHAKHEFRAAHHFGFEAAA